MLKIRVEIGKIGTLKIACPFCHSDIINDNCEHQLMHYDAMAGGYVHLKTEVEFLKEDLGVVHSLDEIEPEFKENDIGFQIYDDVVGDNLFIVLRK